MCGIVGICSFKEKAIDTAWLKKANDKLYHRGPDDEGIWVSEDNKVGFGHRRLSIIDISSNGHQPMEDDSGKCTIVFNGEIYNYKEIREQLISLGVLFKTNSDTEVILQAYKIWGKNCLSKLTGMFAFAIYDKQSNSVFLARDRAGEKPLFFSKLDNEFVFASEIKSLIIKKNIGNNVNLEAMSNYLSVGFVSGEMSIVEGINKLAPGHAMKIDLNTSKLNTWKYWDLPKTILCNEKEYDENGLLTELEELLESSVKRQLVADVPIGVLLSGGVDSSLITALASRSNKKIKTFFVGFDGYQKYDESKHARLIADHFKTEHIELNAGSVNPDILIKLAKQYDEPIIDSSMVPTYLLSEIVSQHCKVVLGGDGGDELFGGYSHYNRMLFIEKKFKVIPYRLRRVISSLSQALPTGFKGKNWLKAIGTDFTSGVPAIATYFDQKEQKKILSKIENYQPEIDIYSAYYDDSTDLLSRATCIDFKNYLAEDILVKVDRASMLNSLEIRAPFLDRELIEFAFEKVPSKLKATDSSKKILLKRLAKKVLPDTFDFQRKQGFSIPLEYWLKKGEWKEFFYDVLLSSDSIYDKKYITQLLKGQEKGLNNSERLFGLVMFQLWKNEYKIKV